MKFCGEYGVEVSGRGTPLAVAACESYSAGIGGGIKSPGANVQSVTSGRSQENHQTTR